MKEIMSNALNEVALRDNSLRGDNIITISSVCFY